jgi:hypothetical protein
MALALCLDCSGVGASRPVLQGIVGYAPGGSRPLRNSSPSDALAYTCHNLRCELQ